MAIVSPSLLSANFCNLEKDIELVNNSNADWFHIDVMDGVFVPNITFGFPVIKQLKKIAKKPFDVHLMIVNPEKYITAFKDVGTDILTVHYEACTHLHRTIQEIKNAGMKAGVSINPHTPVELLSDILCELDLVLIMSVNPGFGGQSFIENSISKVERLSKMINDRGLSVTIEVDGGVNEETGKRLVAAGADALVAGNYVFNAANPSANIDLLKGL